MPVRLQSGSRWELSTQTRFPSPLLSPQTLPRFFLPAPMPFIQVACAGCPKAKDARRQGGVAVLDGATNRRDNILRAGGARSAPLPCSTTTSMVSLLRILAHHAPRTRITLIPATRWQGQVRRGVSAMFLTFVRCCRTLFCDL